MNKSETFISINETDLGIPYSVQIIRQICIAVWANIVLVGVFGNILTVIILTGPKLNTTSTTFYLTVLAVIDLLYLIFSLGGQMFDFALLFPLTMRQKNEVACKLLNIIRYSLAYISVWLLVAVSIDRMIWVLLPFRAKMICTRKIAKTVVLFFSVFFVAIDIHFIWTVEFIRTDSVNYCLIMNNTLFKYTFPYIDLTLIMFLPFVIMLISNILIVIKMRKVSQIRQILHRSSAVLEPCQSDNIKLKKNSISPPLLFQDEKNPKENSSRIRSQSQTKVLNRRTSKFIQKDKQTSSLTKMLLSVNIFFLVSTSPLLVYDVIYYVVDFNDLVKQKGSYLGGIIFGLERLVYTLWYLNFSIHFLLYCLSGPKFREEAKLFIGQYFFRKQFLKQSTVKLNEAKNLQKSSIQEKAAQLKYMKSKSTDSTVLDYGAVYSCIKETRI